jgi:hypothetical protein
VTVMAAEAAAPAASGSAGAASGGSGEAAGSGGAAPGGMGGSLPGGPPSGPQSAKGVLLAVAILLLWIAGFCFFIALEGSTLLTEQSDTSGGGLLKAMISGLATRAAAQESQGAGSQAGG